VIADRIATVDAVALADHADPVDPIVLDEPTWRRREAEHERRVEPWIGPRLARRRVGRSHPVDDFLFDYYPYSPGRLRAWHPGLGIVLAGDASAFLARAHYGRTPHGVGVEPTLDAPSRGRLRLVLRLLAQTAERPPRLDCFGMHEWAMVYGLDPGDVRHAGQPLRMSRAEIVDVVDGIGLRCTHIDAYRFFTDAAAPRNAFRPTRADQHAWEQPGCVHATMDLYKYAMWFQPWVGSDLVADCFALARDAREVDMRAAPYDLGDIGLDPIRVETPDGRAEYVRAQRSLMERGQVLRRHLRQSLTRLERARTESRGPDSPADIAAHLRAR
jgi:hypothetical protein